MLISFDYGKTMSLCVIDKDSNIILNCQSNDLNYICYVVQYYKADYFVCEEYRNNEYSYQVELIKSYLDPETKVFNVKPHAWKYATESKISVETKHFIECTRLALFSMRKIRSNKNV